MTLHGGLWKLKNEDQWYLESFWRQYKLEKLISSSKTFQDERMLEEGRKLHNSPPGLSKALLRILKMHKCMADKS